MGPRFALAPRNARQTKFVCSQNADSNAPPETADGGVCMWTLLRRLTNAILAVAGAGLLLVQFHTAAQRRLAKDPGPRGGSRSAGDPLPGLSDAEKEYFYAAQTEFGAEEGVDEGLGPRMNLDSCKGCHDHPASGGSSPLV